jgi:lauroyl/myristoyl acyltransferase
MTAHAPASPKGGALRAILRNLTANTLFGTLMTLQLVLPDDFIRWWIKPGGYIYYYSAPKTRRAMLYNARHLLGPDSTREKRRELVIAMMTRWCEFMVDLFSFQRVSPEVVLERTPDVRGLEDYLAARARRRGAILVTSHLGNWEYGSVLLQTIGETLNVVFQPDPNVVLRRIFSLQRGTKRVHEVRIGGDPFIWVTLREALKRDELVLIQGDRTTGEGGSVQPFVDGHALFPEGPVKLALASGAPLVPVFVPRTEAGLLAHMYKPMFPDDPGVTEERLMRYMVESIEQCVTTYPEQWLMPQRFWVD